MTDALHITGFKRGHQAPALVFTDFAIDAAPPPSAIASVAVDIRREGTRVVRFASTESATLPRDYPITIDSATGFTIAAHVPNYPPFTYRYQCKIVFANGEPFAFEGNWVVQDDDAYTEAAP